MKCTKLNTIAIKGDKPFIKRYHILADRFFDSEEKKKIEVMTEDDVLKMAIENRWITQKIN
jgi:hypothetical protein